MSRVTVSRALRGDPKISEATTARVKEAATKLGYIPDTRLSELMTYLGNERRSSGIHEEIPYLYCGDYHRNQVAQPAFLRAASHVAEEQGFRMTPYHLRETNKDALEREFHARSVRAMLFAPFSSEDELPELHWDRYSIMGFGLSQPQLKIHRVDWNYRLAVRTTIEQMRGRGYERIGIIASYGYSDGLNFSIEAEAWTDYHHRAGKYGVRPLLNNGIRSDDTAGPIIREWLIEERPNAILCTPSNYARILRLGLVDEYMGFASWWNADEGENVTMAGMLGDVSLLADLGTKTLIGMIHNRHRGLIDHRVLTLVDMSWHDGGSAPGIGKRRTA